MTKIKIAKITNYFKKEYKKRKRLSKELIFVTIAYLISVLLFLGKDFYNIALGEDFMYFLPHYAFTVKSLVNNSLPFWLPYNSLGIPELFDSDFSYFSPGVISVLLFNYVFNPAVDLNVLGKSFQLMQYSQLMIGQVGMYLLLNRHFNVSRIPAFLGGLIYALAPMSIWDLTVITALNGKMLYPFIIYALLNFLNRFNLRNFITLVICNYLIFSFGYPYHILFFIFSEFLLVLFYGVKNVVRFISVIVLTVILSSFFLIPNYHYLSRANDNPAFPAADTTITQDIFAPSSPLRMVNIINPQVYNEFFDARDPNLLFTFSHFHWGVLTLILLLTGFTALKKDKKHLWLLIIFLLGIIYSFGKYLNIPGMFEWTPQLNVFRSIARVLFLPFFAGTIFIALGAEKALKGKENGRIQQSMWLFVMLSLLFLAVIPIICNSCTTTNADLLINLARSILLIALGLLLYYFIVKFKSRTLLVFILFITICELSYYYKSDFRETARMRITYSDYMGRNSLIPEIPSKDNLFRYNSMGNQFVYNTAQLDVFNFTSIESIPSMIPRDLEPRIGFEKAMQYANVKYIVATKDNLSSTYPSLRLEKIIDPAEHPDEVYISDISDKPFYSETSTNKHYIYKVKSYLPRFFVPSAVKSCNADAACYQEFPKISFLNEDNLSFINKSPEKVKIKVQDYKPSSLKLDINAQSETFVVSSEAYSDGWRVKINDKPAKLYNVNGGFRGFIVPSGDTKVSMYYIPEGLYDGLITTFVGLILLFPLFYFRKKIFTDRNKFY